MLLIIKDYLLVEKPHITLSVPLRAKLVAAYLVGTQCGDDTFPSNELAFEHSAAVTNVGGDHGDVRLL